MVKKWLMRLRQKYDFKRRGIKVWQPCNVYCSANIGSNVSIGTFSEIGNNVNIGDNTRIGAGSFIPEGVTIGKNCFIGPKVCFSNDMYPPANKADWQKTVICDDVSIGANASIRPGVTIGSNSLVGMGSVVTKNIPPNEIWAGVPAVKLKDKDSILERSSVKK